MVNENNFKFLAPPTQEQIDKVLKAAGVSEAQFERYHGMYVGLITHVRIGFKKLPSKHWHLFLEEPKSAPNFSPTRKARHNVPDAPKRGLRKSALASKLR